MCCVFFTVFILIISFFDFCTFLPITTGRESLFLRNGDSLFIYTCVNIEPVYNKIRLHKIEELQDDDKYTYIIE